MSVKLSPENKYLIELLLMKYSIDFDEFNFDKIYSMMDKEGINHDCLKLFYLWLLDNEVDPLLHMTVIPKDFFIYDTDVKEITIPANIRFIRDGAFTGSEFKTVNIMNPNIVIEDDAFKWCEKIKQVNFNGTLKLLYDNNRLSNKFTTWSNQPKLFIECTDTVVDFEIGKY